MIDGLHRGVSGYLTIAQDVAEGQILLVFNCVGNLATPRTKPLELDAQGHWSFVYGYLLLGVDRLVTS